LEYVIHAGKNWLEAKLNGKFEFLGWWKGNCNTWYLDVPLEEADNLNDNMFLLRRK
jgi:hypothetical protein